MKTSLSEIDEVAGSLKDVISELEKAGIKRDRIVIGNFISNFPLENSL